LLDLQRLDKVMHLDDLFNLQSTKVGSLDDLFNLQSSKVGSLDDLQSSKVGSLEDLLDLQSTANVKRGPWMICLICSWRILLIYKV
jgi:hypothetical protein